ncbi:MAG: hypothetical protein KDK70_28430, partial [Myxococcales bacterium]|nr:hypothetical protein [Myxococcales bacterium]
MQTAGARRWWLLAVLSGLGCDGPPRPTEAGIPLPEAAPVPWASAIRPVGRHRWMDPARMRYGWSGSGFTLRMVGTAVHVRLDDAARHHAVIVDGEELEPLHTEPGERRYAVVEGLPPGEHEVTLLRRTEGHLGPTTLLGVEVAGSLHPVPEPAAHVEVIGDSITTGYGNEGLTRLCRYSPQTQNHQRTYAALAARAVGAELSTIAWSGKGVVHNYGDDRVEPLPALYERSVPTEPDSRWDFSVPADVVVINLGTNDFSTDGDPSEEEFVAGYVELLARVRAHHPEAVVLVTVAPLLGEAERSVVEVYVEQALAQRRRAGDEALRWIDLQVDAEGWGCDWHPSAATHEAMARRLEPELRRALQ